MANSVMVTRFSFEPDLDTSRVKSARNFLSLPPSRSALPLDPPLLHVISMVNTLPASLQRRCDELAPFREGSSKYPQFVFCSFGVEADPLLLLLRAADLKENHCNQF